MKHDTVYEKLGMASTVDFFHLLTPMQSAVMLCESFITSEKV